MYADILKNIVNNYERYKSIAVNLKWTESDSKYYDWVEYPMGIYVTVCNFTKGYVKNNFEQAYVQTVLTYIDYDGFADFRNASPSKCLKYMMKYKDICAEYMTYHAYRMKPVTEDYLIQQIKCHAKDNDIPESEINSVIPYVTGAENIEIGGFYPADHTFISIKDNSIMLADFVLLN